jgi:hypothetical protein
MLVSYLASYVARTSLSLRVTQGSWGAFPIFEQKNGGKKFFSTPHLSPASYICRKPCAYGAMVKFLYMTCLPISGPPWNSKFLMTIFICAFEPGVAAMGMVLFQAHS